MPDQLVSGEPSNQLIPRTTDAVELLERLHRVHDLLRSWQLESIRTPETEDNSLFNIGDKVLVERKRKKKGVNPKLQVKFDGPFVVKKVFGNGTYKVQGRGTVHECRLKLFITSEDPCSQLSQPPQLADPSSDSELVNDPIQNSQQYLDRSPGNYATGRSRRRRGRPSRLDDYVVYSVN